MLRNIHHFIGCLFILLACTVESPSPKSEQTIESEGQNDPNELSVTSLATDITEWSATLSAYANLTPEMSTFEMGIFYSTDETPSVDNAKKLTSRELDADHKYSIAIKDLPSATTYYYRSFVLYGGVYRYGKIKSFTTKTVNAKLMPEPTIDISLFSATIQCRLTIESTEELPREVLILYSDNATTLAELISKGEKEWAYDPYEDNTSYEDNTLFMSDLNKLEMNTVYYYVPCAKVYDCDEIYGEVGKFQTKEFTKGVLIDMGLSVKWASCNLGEDGLVSSPEEFGAYFAWGETSSKTDYTKNNYTYTLTSSVLPLTDDVAYVKLHGNYRMPIAEEFTELVNNSSIIRGKYHSVSGTFFVSNKNGNVIFFPNAGIYSSSYYNWDCGEYWSSSIDSSNSSRIMTFQCENSNPRLFSNPAPWEGLSVRPVSD